MSEAARIYILSAWVNYEGETVLGAYATLADATDALWAVLPAEKHADGVSIVAIEIGAAPEVDPGTCPLTVYPGSFSEWPEPSRAPHVKHPSF